MHIEAIQITSSSGKYKANTYHHNCYLRLFVFEFHVNKRLLLLSSTL